MPLAALNRAKEWWECVVQAGETSNDPDLDRFSMLSGWKTGLSQNTLAAYRRDLNGLAVWLKARRNIMASLMPEVDLHGYMVHLHGNSQPSSVGRRLSVFRRFYRWAIREGRIQVDPTVRMDAPRQRQRLPHS